MNYKMLKALRTDHDLTQKEVAEYLHIGRSTYSAYESGTTEPPPSLFIALADFYHVSIDYLAGLTDVPAPYEKQ